MAKRDLINSTNLDDLDAKISSLRNETRSKSEKSSRGSLSPSLAGIAARAGVELVAGVVVGLALGYGIDSWLNTSPWMLIVGFVLGAAAGMMNVYRAVNNMGMAVGYRKNNINDNADTTSK